MEKVAMHFSCTRKFKKKTHLALKSKIIERYSVILRANYFRTTIIIWLHSFETRKYQQELTSTRKNRIMLHRKSRLLHSSTLHFSNRLFMKNLINSKSYLISMGKNAARYLYNFTFLMRRKIYFLNINNFTRNLSWFFFHHFSLQLHWTSCTVRLTMKP